MDEPCADRAVEEYYRTIDAGEYDALAAVLAPEFVHRRPDRTIEGRETFVGFMRDERPRTDTTHVIDARFVGSDDHGDRDGRGGRSDSDSSDVYDTDASASDGTRKAAVAGQLLDTDGRTLFEFVDRHELAAGRIQRITTYTR